MANLLRDSSLAKIVSEHPAWIPALEEFRLDYCCNGYRTLEEACVIAGVDCKQVLDRLEHMTEPDSAVQAEFPSGSASEVIDYLVRVHHAYVREHLPRLCELSISVAKVHGSKLKETMRMAQVLDALNRELMLHLRKEEQILFPMILELESSNQCGILQSPVRMMRFEHDQTGALLGVLSRLVESIKKCENPCASTTALINGVVELIGDLHRHIFVENQILFPMVETLERERSPMRMK